MPGDLLTDPETGRSYDRIAAAYADRLGAELAGKPFDRAELDRFADRTRGRGPVLDLGCGPGQVAAYLRDRGAEVVGLDLSAGMVAEARRRVPGVRFEVADLRSLDDPDGAYAGVVAFYSLIHLPAGELPAALAGIRRVLAPGGPLLAAFHVGTEVRHLDRMWDHDVSLDFHFFRTEQVTAAMAAAGLAVTAATERDPYPAVEVATRRGYVWGQVEGHVERPA